MFVVIRLALLFKGIIDFNKIIVRLYSPAFADNVIFSVTFLVICRHIYVYLIIDYNTLFQLIASEEQQS